MKTLNQVIKNTDKMLLLSEYEKDKKLFHIYQKSGFCLWTNSFRAYCKVHNLHKEVFKLP